MKASLPVARLFQLMQVMKSDDAPLLKALLGYSKDPQLMVHINKALFSKDTQLRLLAAQSLANTATTDNIHAVLMEVAQKPATSHPEIIRFLVENGGRPFLNAVEKLMNDPDKNIRNIALTTTYIHNPNNPRIFDTISHHIDNDIPTGIKQAFIKKLGRDKNSKAARLLTDTLRKDPDPGNRVLVLQALGKIAHGSAFLDVLKMLNENDANVQNAALACLSKITPEKFAHETRERLIKDAGKFRQLVLPNLISLLEKMTEKYHLPKTTAYTRVIRKLKAKSQKAKQETSLPDMIKNQGEKERLLPLNIAEGLVLSDRYKLMKEIGNGSHGLVWLAEDTFIQEKLVMKFLHQALTSDKVAIKRFIREFKLAKKITHTNIIRLFDFLNFGGTIAISMEYFPGASLSSIIHQNNTIEPARTIKLARTVCAALQAAHQVNVIHRDIKPANILVDKNDTVKIIDFGIASVNERTELAPAQDSTMVGTPNYISPEQIENKPIDERSDLYSLGIIMYEMLAGHPPYQAKDPLVLIFLHIQGNAHRLEKTNPAIPKGLADVVHRCIAPRPSARYQNMTELDKALSRLDSA